MRTRSPQRAYRSPILLAYVVWSAFVVWSVGDALRHGDEATYINSAWQIAEGMVSPWHVPVFDYPTFLNYNFQYGSYWLLTALFRVTGLRSAVLVSNYAQVILLCVALGTLVFLQMRRISFFLALPFFLCPALTLYAPFMGPGILSLAFLLMAFAIMRRGNRTRQGIACLLVVIAAACRADVVLSIPTLIMTEISRRSFRQLLSSPFAWAISLCSIFPPLIGRYFLAGPFALFQTSPPSPTVIAGLIVFGLGLIVVPLLTWSSVFFLGIAAGKARWRWFYLIRAIAPVIPLAFYMRQLWTPEQLLLTLACYGFAICERRAVASYSWLIRPESPGKKLISALVLLSAALPWLLGLKASNLKAIRPTLGPPQAFPTSHGYFPMGAYAYYIIYGRTHRYDIDHNERIFRAAQDVNYESRDGKVPVLYTPMWSFLELAVRLRKLAPDVVIYSGRGASPYAYADARSLLRNVMENSRDLLRGASVAASYDGEVILKLGSARTELGSLLQALFDRFSEREVELYPEEAGQPFHTQKYPNGGMIYALSAGDCSVIPDKLGRADIRELDGKRLYLWTVANDPDPKLIGLNCAGGGDVGQAAWTLPRWMGSPRQAYLK
jgi:hypothetical protein